VWRGSSTGVTALNARHSQGENIPKRGMHALAMCAAPGQVDYFVALALQCASEKNSRSASFQHQVRHSACSVHPMESG
jgi:hypothetical protein